jgi:hypothetical protein
MYGLEVKGMRGSGGGNLRGRDHLEDPDVDARIILKWISKNGDAVIH